jgi:hypothetical protein
MAKGEIDFVVWMVIGVVLLIAVVLVIISLNAKGIGVMDGLSKVLP